METSDFLRDTVIRLEDEMAEIKGHCQETQKSVNQLDKNLAIWEARIATKSQNQSAFIAFFVAIALQIAGTLLDKVM